MKFNIPEFTVSEFSRSIKRTVEDAFGYIRIRGEISGFKRATSGHLYFTLKDENAVLTAVCFRNMAQLISFEIVDGLQVTASGRITTFEGRSSYQIIVEKLEMAGIGAILAMIEERRQKLMAEGLFDAKHKKPLPFFPKIIGVITSPTGAVIEDIKNRLDARCGVHLIIYPSLMQGNKAAPEVIEGIKYFNNLEKNRPEILIIARGGGSIEDLLPFNDEELVRAVFKSEIPIISAIGHETDTNLIDYVSDLRAATPTAAAELAVPVLEDLKNNFNYLNKKLSTAPQNFIAKNLQKINDLKRYIIDPKKILEQIQKRFISLEKQISKQNILQQINLFQQKMEFAAKSIKSRADADLKNKNIALQNLEKLLKSNNHKAILKRGFALVARREGGLITSSKDLKNHDRIAIEMFDGKVEAIVE